jgi:hypothetical protein
MPGIGAAGLYSAASGELPRTSKIFSLLLAAKHTELSNRAWHGFQHVKRGLFNLNFNLELVIPQYQDVILTPDFSTHDSPNGGPGSTWETQC